MADVKSTFNTFITRFDVKASDALWNNYSAAFHDFWNSKILNERSKSSESDYDPIIRILDAKGKGFNSKVDEAVAMTYVRQGVWYRTFNDLKTKRDIRDLLNQIFQASDDADLITLVNALQMANQANKNGLTGRNANVLNALLFVNNPGKFIGSVSLNHRRQLIQSLGIGDFDSLTTFGEKVILSNRLILDFFSRSIEGKWSPRTLSRFLYYEPFQSLWLTKPEAEKRELVSSEEESVDSRESEFVLEKHLEDFLVGYWESSPLGRIYELIEEEDEVVSQQYPTDIGKIDLLVRSKANREYTVIELKKGQTSDDTVGQLARYMGWVKEKLANGHTVHGIIIAGATDVRLKYALSMVPNTKLMIYRINFNLDED